MDANSNDVFVGCGQKSRGVIAANGVILTDDLGGLTMRTCTASSACLDTTTNAELH
jgi:hypothetical protein